MSVSWGTLRSCDLVPSFLKELEKRDEGLAKEAKLMLNKWGYELDSIYDEDSQFYQEEDSHWFLEILDDSLNEVAPKDTYFGAHPGDGSDFGYWPTEWLP